MKNRIYYTINMPIKGGSQCSEILFILHIVDRKYIGLFKYCLQ